MGWGGAQQFAGGLVDQVDFAAIGAQVLELQAAFGMLDSGCETREASWPRSVGVTVAARQHSVA